MKLDKRYVNYIIGILLLFLVGGCATGGMMTVANVANIAGGKEAAKYKNPLIEAEIDLTLVDEVSAMIKVNEILLDRLPISYEDPWPELLNDYQKTKLNKKQKKAKKRYNDCLRKLLKKDFSFYDLYDANAYAVSILSTGNFWSSALGALGSRLFIEGSENLGIEFEHAKSVISYVPFCCQCKYFKPSYCDLSPGASICKKIRSYPEYRKCTFFNRPVEDMLSKYLFSAGGIKHWADLPIDLSCFRAVKGEQLGTFKDVFYSILPPSIRMKIERVDSELMVVQSDYESVKARLKDKKLSKAERAALKKKKAMLYKEVHNKKAIQKKLYHEALSTLYVTEENIRKAKKLREIVDYIDRNFAETMLVMTQLTLKIINDVQTISQMNLARAFITYPFLVKKGVFRKRNKKYYEHRFSNIVKKLVTLPVTYFEILGYAMAQKYQVSKYKGYLDAMLKMEKKLKKNRG